ncbi:GNAT family N-acetyltransferase [Saccharicrinis sp. 156]|uniref:GNAT family N-acetyltransferase n=1 Tax=Saccharicrinis sp. 156 TaxID=3417574 RepID=UPI003D328BDD
MEKLLIYIKHRLHFIWKLIESLNDYLFYILYSKRLKVNTREVLGNVSNGTFIFKEVNFEYANQIYELINSQDEIDLKYFKPHGFDLESIKKQFSKKAFLMMGVFSEEKLVGYFFLRFFANRKCFVGRLIDKDYRGKGIGNVMNTILYRISWNMGFRCLSTISKDNKAVVSAHKKNQSMIVLKELSNNYLLVEFVEKEN